MDNDTQAHQTECFGLSHRWCYAGLAITESLPAVVFLSCVGTHRLYNLVYNYPLIKPASSIRYNCKLFLTLLAISLVVFISVRTDGMYGYSATIAPLVLTLCAWIESLVILILGNHRAEPQKFYGLRLWWGMVFVSNSIIFFMHSVLHAPSTVHWVRAGYLVSCIGLVWLSFYPADQATYEPLVLASEGSPQSNPSSTTSPLLQGATTSLNGTGTYGTAGRPKLSKRLSSKVLMAGASTSVYKRAFEDWNNALEEGRQSQEDADEGETDKVMVTAADS